MMKKFIYAYLLVAAIFGGLITSCSNDEEIILPQVTQETVFMDKTLALTYSDEPLLGKQVKFTPDANDPYKATLELSGTPLPAIALTETEEMVGTSGIIPGEKSTVINVTLRNTDNETTFEGEDNTNARTLKYSGKVKNGVLELSLSVTVKNALSGKSFDLVPYKETGKDKSNPITLDWSSTVMVPLFSPEMKVEMNYFIRDLIGGTKIIPVPNSDKAINIGEALSLVLNQITFLPDGNIIAKYKDGFEDTEWKTSPKNLANYSIGENGKIRLHLNLAAISEAAGPQFMSRLGLEDALKVLLTHLYRIIEEGATITFNENKGVTEFYLDQETVFNVLNDLVPYFQDEEFRTQVVSIIIALLPQDEEGQMEQLIPLIQTIVSNLLSSIPEVMEGTTNLHFGINTLEVK